MIDLLSLIGTVLGDRNADASRAQQGQQFNQNLAFQGAESERGRQFSARESAADRSARLNEFNTSQQLAREQFVQQVKQQALEYGLSQRQAEEQIRQFDSKLATDREQFAQNLAQSESQFAQNLAQNASQFGQSLGLDQAQLAQQGSQFGQTFANTQAQQKQAQQNYGGEFGLQQQKFAADQAQNKNTQLGQLANLFGAGAQNQGQADILALLAGNLGVPTNALQLLNAAKLAKPVSPAGGTGQLTNAGWGVTGPVPENYQPRYLYPGSETWTTRNRPF